MMAISSGCGLCPWSCSGKVGAYVCYSGFRARGVCALQSSSYFCTPQKASVGMYSRYDYLLFVCFLILPSLLHSSIIQLLGQRIVPYEILVSDKSFPFPIEFSCKFLLKRRDFNLRCIILTK